MLEEIRVLTKNETWELCFNSTRKEDDWLQVDVHYKTQSRYKGRLVVKGFTQTYGVDYQEIFTPVVKLNTIRILLSCVANLDWDLHQFDVKNVFLHGDLEKEVYIQILHEFEDERIQGKVCKLKKVLYELKQFPRIWFEMFIKVIIFFKYQQSNVDHTLLIKHCEV